MELRDRRCLVAGATGALGGRLAGGLVAAGARVGLAGRDATRLATLAAELDAPTAPLDLLLPGSAEACVATLERSLGGLDLLVLATGAVAFGPAGDLGAEVERELFAVNALGPIRLIGAALPHLGRGAGVVGLSAVVAEHPTANLAAYSASKAALSAFLLALRRERRRDGLQVLDVRPPHLDTGFETRALAGAPPRLPQPVPAADVVKAILAALREDRRELAWDVTARALVAS